ncbi:MAG: M13 family metallopeptidase [Hyphomonadaceae bacterium]|nr:M13 family metallopeptidase [Hyphomonadaceae bacterium]
MLNFSRRAFGVSTLALAAGCATNSGGDSSSGASSSGSAAIGEFGLDLTAGDTSVRPGDDFFRYANDRWLDTTDIPSDQRSWGTFVILGEKASRDQRAIIEEVALAGGAPGSVQQKIAASYNAYLNTDAINARGLAPLQPDLASIAALQTHEDVIRLMARNDIPTNGPIVAFAGLDARNPQRYIVSFTHAGLGLPEREYYRRADGEANRAAYVAYIERVLTLGGQANGAAKARAIMALETQIAELHWPVADRRQRDRTYNLKTRAELRAIAPNFPWDAGLEAAGMGQATEVVVRELSAMAPLAQLFLATPVATWRDYLTYNLISGSADVLPSAIDDANFDFYGRTLNGQPEQQERWKRAVDTIDNVMGEAVGQLYVQRHFPPQAKAQMLELVENLRRAYAQRIDQSPWMTAETKVVAQQKLAAFVPRIGYPDRWRDFTGLEASADDAYGNFKRANKFNGDWATARLWRPVDRGEWNMTPQTVNASYNSVLNVITFPAAILQPPFFDPNADAAVNYGAIGGVIGHEMGHGFDDQGAKSDAQGILRDWWSPQDVAAFSEVTGRLAAQYDGFEALPGLNVNGRLTLGENIGDNGGLQVALRAYELSLGAREAPVRAGLTGKQRFFLGWAQAWRSKYREEALRNMVMTNPHSPPQFRVNGVVHNMDTWYEAFNVQPDAALYLPPADRVTIW